MKKEVAHIYNAVKQRRVPVVEYTIWPRYLEQSFMELFQDTIVTLQSKNLPKGRYKVAHMGIYADGSPGIIIYKNGMVWAKATVCLAGYDLKPAPGNCFIKTWNENEGILEALIKAKVIEYPVRRIPIGEHDILDCVVAECKIRRS